MKDGYNLSEIAEKRLEESNLKINQDNSKLSRIGEMALYSTVPDKNGEEVRLDSINSDKLNKIEKIVQDDELFENFKREMNLARLCNINDRLPRMLSLGHDDFHVFGVDLIDRDRVGVLMLPYKSVLEKLEENENDLNCLVKFMDYIDASDDEKFKDCKFEVKSDLGIGLYYENDFGITMFPYVDGEDGKTKCNFIVGKTLYELDVNNKFCESLVTDDNYYIDDLLKVHNREKHSNVDCLRYDNDKLGSVLEINEEVLRFDHRISMYEAICQNNILFTKEIDIENINLDFLDEAVKITNENNFVESRRHLYEAENYDGLLKHFAENDIIDKDNYYKLVAERAIFDSTKDFRTKEADYLAAKNNVEMKEQELNDAVNDLKIKEQAFIDAVSSVTSKEQDKGMEI